MYIKLCRSEVMPGEEEAGGEVAAGGELGWADSEDWSGDEQVTAHDLLAIDAGAKTEGRPPTRQRARTTMAGRCDATEQCRAACNGSVHETVLQRIGGLSCSPRT